MGPGAWVSESESVDDADGYWVVAGLACGVWRVVFGVWCLMQC